MNNLRLSVHTPEYCWLREKLITRRQELGLSQRALAERLSVVYSFVGKVETGDRRLDIFELIKYCAALELDMTILINEIQSRFPNNAI